MKKRTLVCMMLMVSLYTIHVSYAQQRSEVEQVIPVNSPDAMAFSQVSFLPMNEYTGKPGITIPIYEIAFGDLKIPVGLSYNYGGVKVNSVASSVGTNWSLLAGGSIIKQVNGLPDFKATPGGSIGYMRGPFSDTGNTCYGNDYQEGEPDLYNVRAPGLGTSFITTPTTSLNIWNQPNIPAKEVSHDGNRIDVEVRKVSTSLQIRTSPTTSSYSDFIGPVKAKITAINGYEYSFENFNSLSSVSQITDWVNGNSYPSSIGGGSQISSIDLTSVYNPKTGKTLVFEYEFSPSVHDFNNTKGVFGLDGSLHSKIVQINRTKSRRIKKITFDLGMVEFFYDFVRADLPNTNNANNNALSRILVKNNDGTIIKDARFSYANKKSTENCNEDVCHRLFLEGVQFFGKHGETVPGYTFVYNATKLPKRYSYKQDFLGYYNGAVANPEPAIAGHYIPKTYHYPNQGKNSFLPISIGNTNYQALNGNYSLASNVSYAKAGILEKIIYPTGGYTKLISESHQFKHLGTTIYGGGLRIKEQEIYDYDHTLKRRISYEYVSDTNSTSGFITYMPRFNSYKFTRGNNKGLGIYQSDMANQKLTNASYIGYARVTIKESGNGYTVKEFTTPMDYPNLPGSWTLSGYNNGEPPTNIINEAAANGCFPNIVTDQDILRGKIKKATYFSEQNSLVKKVENTYQYKNFQSVPIFGGIPYEDPNGDGCDTYPVLKETAQIKIARNLKKETKETHYLDGGSKLITYQTTYDPDYPLPEESTVIDGQRTLISSYFYPHSPTVSSNSYMSELRLQNRYSEVIKVETYEATQKLITQTTNYHDFGNNKYLSKSVSVGKGNGPERTNVIIDKRDAYGNILESHTRDGVYTSYIYGYTNNLLVAKIENATYTSAIAALPVSLAQLQALDSRHDESTLIGYFTTLRTGLPNATIVSYTYIPSVGVSTITDNRGKTMRYVYDAFHRLSLVKDSENKIVKRYEYHYKNQ